MNDAEHVPDSGPLDEADRAINAMTAQLQREFLETFEVLDAATVHCRAGHETSRKPWIATSWRRSGRVLGLPFEGAAVYPGFQFDENGQPFPLMRDVLGALPANWSEWQRAFWLVSPNEWLDRGEGMPCDAIRSGDRSVLTAAEQEGETTVG